MFALSQLLTAPHSLGLSCWRPTLQRKTCRSGDNKGSKSQQCLGAKAAQGTWGGAGWEVILPQWGHIYSTSSRSGSPAQGKQGRTGEGPAEATKMMRGLQQLCYEERLRKFSLLSLGKKWLRENLTNTDKYPKGGCQENEARLFPVVPSDLTRGNGHKQEHRKLHLSMSENFFSVGLTEHCNRLLREAVEFPSMEMLDFHLDITLCTLRLNLH